MLIIACTEPTQPSTQTTKSTTAIIQKDTVQAKSAAEEAATFTKTHRYGYTLFVRIRKTTQRALCAYHH